LKEPFKTTTLDDILALFQAKSLSTTNSSTVNTTSSSSLSYASDFSVVESQVTTMVGEETHVTTTGLDQQIAQTNRRHGLPTTTTKRNTNCGGRRKLKQ
jgi:hypothetical protein